MGKVNKKDLRLSIEARLTKELFKLVELEVFTLDEAQKAVARHKVFEHGALSIRDKPRKLEAYLHWLTFLIALQCLVKQRLNTTKKSEDGDTVAPNERLSTERRNILSNWFNLVFRLFKRWHHDFPDDLRVDLTILDYLLKNGSTRLFDKFINKALINNPRHFDLWMLAIDRQRQAGNLQAALRMCQKAHRFHKEEAALDKTMENLATALLLGVILEEQNAQAATDETEPTVTLEEQIEAGPSGSAEQIEARGDGRDSVAPTQLIFIRCRSIDLRNRPRPGRCTPER